MRVLARYRRIFSTFSYRTGAYKLYEIAVSQYTTPASQAAPAPNIGGIHQHWWKGVAPLPWGAVALVLCFLVIHALCTADMPTPVHGQESSTRWSSTLRRRRRLVFRVWKRMELMCCDMKTGILEGNEKEWPNYDVTCTINVAAIVRISRRPRCLHQPPKSVKRLKCTSCIMKTGTSRYSIIDRLNYDVTWTQLPVRLPLYWLMSLSPPNLDIYMGPVLTVRCFLTPME